jgi:hypothetical protein
MGYCGAGPGQKHTTSFCQVFHNIRERAGCTCSVKIEGIHIINHPFVTDYAIADRLVLDFSYGYYIILYIRRGYVCRD